jgi:hypothetical protein
MSISISPNLPANVVEIGNEITQSKINEINAGTLALQTWVSASYLTTATASSTYQTLSGMTSYLTTSAASSTYQPIGSYLVDAPSDGSEYVRKNAAWAVVTGGGGIPDAPSNGNLYARQNAAWTAFSVTPSVTNIDLTGNFNGYSMGSGYYSFKYDSSANTLRMQDGVGSGLTVSATGITFPDSTTLTTSPSAFVDAPSDGNYYVRKNGAWHQCQIASVYDNTTMSNQDVLRT